MSDGGKKLILLLASVFFVAAIGFILWKTFNASLVNNNIKSFDDCVKAGYPVMESYPRQCKAPNGTFIEKISGNTATPAETGALEIIPGLKSVLYKDNEFGFELYYPDGSTVRKENSEGFLHVAQNAAVGIFLPETLFAGTNLSEAAVVVGVDPSAEAIDKCSKPDSQEQSLGVIKIGGIVFNVFGSLGAAAGNLYESKIYRAEKRGSCYEIAAVLHSGNIGNYPAGTVKEFDKAKFSGYLEKIVNTFAFMETAGSGVLGIVVLSPACPAERIPPDPKCAPKPYKTTVTITNNGFIKQVKSGDDGKFRVGLESGNYKFSAQGGSILPRCEPISATVRIRAYIPLEISCDTGIR